MKSVRIILNIIAIVLNILLIALLLREGDPECEQEQ